jgi:SAM-dependent methyltransferase
MTTTDRHSGAKWPKPPAVLTAEQKAVADEFMMLWHEILPSRYQLLERFNHGYPARQRPRLGGDRIRTLEIGGGLGEHIAFEDLSGQDYYVNELRPSMAERIVERFPAVEVVVGDCQQRLDFDDGFFDRVVAIHVLEHLRNLPSALAEIRRLLKPEGQLCVVIPCEGGWAYSFARNISTRRIFEKRFNMPYDWCIQSEHVNLPAEIFEELAQFFEITNRSYFPLVAPSVQLNLVIGLTLRPRRTVAMFAPVGS